MPIWYEPSRRRSLLGTRGANPAQAVGRRSRALRSVPAGARHSDKAPGRSLLAWEWDTPYNAEFTAVSSFVSSLCKDPTNQYNLDYPTDSYQFLEDGTGFPQGVQVIHDSGVCAQRDTKWVSNHQRSAVPVGAVPPCLPSVPTTHRCCHPVSFCVCAVHWHCCPGLHH